MTSIFILFIVLLIIFGAITADSFVFTIIYFIALSIILTNWWLNHVISKINVERKLPSHTFPGEVISIELEFHNTSNLPVPWLYIQESISVELAPSRPFRQVINLSGKGCSKTGFKLFPQKRGYYSVGPLTLTSGDLMGLFPEVSKKFGMDHITVYPQILPISNFPLRSRSPQGGIKNYQPLNEDSSRPIGKRDYLAGDSLRRIDWKSSAAFNKLQVKLFEPSIAYQTLILLDLNASGYHPKSIYDGSELAIVVASSLSSWLINQKQAVGLYSNGLDAMTSHETLTYSPRNGSAHLMKILESLARIKLSNKQSLEELLQQKLRGIPLGTSLTIITGHCDDDLFVQLELGYLLGKDISLILCGEVPGWQEVKRKAHLLSIPTYHFMSGKDFKNWQTS